MQEHRKQVREIPANPFLQNQNRGKRLRVAAYCRVSTEQEEQESSFENQVAYYTNLIQSNPEWECAGIFADRGISGTKDTIRPEFMKMIEQCKKHKIDLILTKSLSRFSRNTLDSITYIRLLKSLNVAVEFEKEGLNTSDVSSGNIKRESFPFITATSWATGKVRMENRRSNRKALLWSPGSSTAI